MIYYAKLFSLFALVPRESKFQVVRHKFSVYNMLCAIWYHLYNLKKREKHSRRIVFLVKLQATESNTPPWVFFMFFKLPKCTESRIASHMIEFVFSD